MRAHELGFRFCVENGRLCSVVAINVVDDLSLDAVLNAATELDAPLIVQASLKTVKSIGAKPLHSMWRARDEVPLPMSLHLGHCPDREWISICLKAGSRDPHRARPVQAHTRAPARAPDRVDRASPNPDGPARRQRPHRSSVTDLIARGCAKVNISTALKIAFVGSHREYLEASPASTIRRHRVDIPRLRAGVLGLAVTFEQPTR
jgi:Fructose-bisphosphate aldolase class-II